MKKTVKLNECDIRKMVMETLSYLIKEGKNKYVVVDMTTEEIVARTYDANEACEYADKHSKGGIYPFAVCLCDENSTYCLDEPLYVSSENNFKI